MLKFICTTMVHISKNIQIFNKKNNLKLPIRKTRKTQYIVSNRKKVINILENYEEKLMVYKKVSALEEFSTKLSSELQEELLSIIKE